MARTLKYLTEDERDDFRANNLMAREAELVEFDAALAQHEHALASLPTDDSEQTKYLRDYYSKQIRDTLFQRAISQRAYDGMESQVTNANRHSAAVARVRAARDAAKNR